MLSSCIPGREERDPAGGSRELRAGRRCLQGRDGVLRGLARVPVKNLVCLKLQPRGLRQRSENPKENTAQKVKQQSGAISRLRRGKSSMEAAPKGLVGFRGVGGMCRDGAGMIPLSGLLRAHAWPWSWHCTPPPHPAGTASSPLARTLPPGPL